MPAYLLRPKSGVQFYHTWSLCAAQWSHVHEKAIVFLSADRNHTKGNYPPSSCCSFMLCCWQPILITALSVHNILRSSVSYMHLNALYTSVCIQPQLIGGLDLVPWAVVSPDVWCLEEHTALETFPHAIWSGWLWAGPPTSKQPRSKNSLKPSIIRQTLNVWYLAHQAQLGHTVWPTSTEYIASP